MQPQIIYRAVKTSLRTLDETARTIEFTSSTETPDRYGDVIRVAGWDLTNFQKNPVFLFGHRSEDPPIGKVLASTKQLGDSPALIQTVQFASKDVYPFADTIFKLYRDGFMNAVSVGFLPLDSQALVDEETGQEIGYEFLEQELLELSAVPIPANPQALGRIYKNAKNFDASRIGELFLREAVAQKVIDSEEASRVEKFICGDKNPPWAYNVYGVTFSSEEDSVKTENEFARWKAASRNAERLAERFERIVEKMEKIAGIAPEPVVPFKNLCGCDSTAPEPVVEAKSVVPFKHQPLAPDDEPWDAAKEMDSATTPDQWETMCTVIDGDPQNKTSYKLPHHKGPNGKYATVRRGVANALARLEQTQMPESDRNGARAHLVRHMDEFRERDGEGASFGGEAFERSLKFIGTALRGSKTESESAFWNGILLAFLGESKKGASEAFAYVQSAHEDVSRAHKKMSLAIGHLAATTADPDGDNDSPDGSDEPDADDQQKDLASLLSDFGFPNNHSGERASKSLSRDAELPHQTAQGGNEPANTSDPTEVILRALTGEL